MNINTYKSVSIGEPDDPSWRASFGDDEYEDIPSGNSVQQQPSILTQANSAFLQKMARIRLCIFCLGAENILWGASIVPCIYTYNCAFGGAKEAYKVHAIFAPLGFLLGGIIGLTSGLLRGGGTVLGGLYEMTAGTLKELAYSDIRNLGNTLVSLCTESGLYGVDRISEDGYYIEKNEGWANFPITETVKFAKSCASHLGGDKLAELAYTGACMVGLCSVVQELGNQDRAVNKVDKGNIGVVIEDITFAPWIELSPEKKQEWESLEASSTSRKSVIIPDKLSFKDLFDCLNKAKEDPDRVDRNKDVRDRANEHYQNVNRFVFALFAEACQKDEADFTKTFSALLRTSSELDAFIDSYKELTSQDKQQIPGVAKVYVILIKTEAEMESGYETVDLDSDDEDV